MKNLFIIHYVIKYETKVSGELIKPTYRIFADYDWALAFYDQCSLVDKGQFQIIKAVAGTYNFVLDFGYFGCDEINYAEFNLYGKK